MTLKKRAFQPGAATLEPRLLMSVAEVSTFQTMSKPLITETLQGRYQYKQDTRIADAPLRIRLSGAGQTDPTARMAGTLNFGGFMAEGSPDINGVVTLANKQGTLKVRLTGSGGNGEIAGKEFALKATVVKGTGAYAGVQSVGNATLSFATDPVRNGRATSGHVMLALNLDSPTR